MQSRLITIVSCVLWISLCMQQAAAQCELTWSDSFALPGAFGSIHDMQVFDDGSGPALYVGGNFRINGGIRGVGKWDGTSWSGFGLGLSDVFSLAHFDDGLGGGVTVYAGGSFGQGGANRIAKWNGSAWVGLGSGANSTVNCMAVYDDGDGPALYAGGDFQSMGNTAARRIAKWDGQEWLVLGESPNGTDGRVQALAVHDDGSGPALFVGGDFTTAGGLAASNIAKWDGAQWSNVGILNGRVEHLASFDDGSGSALFVGGYFTTINGAPINYIAKRTGTMWSAAGTIQDKPTAISSDLSGPDGALLISVGTTPYELYRWNQGTWTPFGGSVTGTVHALARFDDQISPEPAVYAAGYFSKAGTLHSNSIARWNGASWTNVALGNGVNGNVYAMAEGIVGEGDASALYVAGTITHAGQVPVDAVARWNGILWTSLNTGLQADQYIRGLSVLTGPFETQPALFAGGNFLQIGGVNTGGLAKWNGAAWSQVGGLVVGDVGAITSFHDGSTVAASLFVGGAIFQAGNVSVSHIARWNGTSWDSLNGGMNVEGYVYDFEVFDDGTGPALFVGGAFTSAGGVQVTRIAKWNGTQWSAVGGVVNGTVFALEVFDDGNGPALYAGGSFSSAGGISALNIAKWNGSVWSAVGAGLNSEVFEMLALHGKLYVGGAFNTAGGMSAKKLAQWDGSTWSTVGGGVIGDTTFTIRALSPFTFPDQKQPALFVGGIGLLETGPYISQGIARWSCPLDVIVPDCDYDGISDTTAIASGASSDCNGNGVPDQCDIGGGGSYDLDANGIPDECESPPWPASSNDLCSNAKLVSSSLLFDTQGAHTDGPNEPALCNMFGYTHIENDVWFRYFATCAGSVRISLCGSTFDAKMAVYTSCPTGPGQAIACSDDFCGSSPRIVLQQSSPTVYRIRVGGRNGATGIGVIKVSCLICPADIDQNGVVNVNDLLNVINNWGSCTADASPCPSDVNADLYVNASDLLAVINAWGACP